MTIKINAKALGIKKQIEIKPTIGLKQETNQIMMCLLQEELPNEQSDVEIDLEALSDEEKAEKQTEALEKTIARIKKEQELTHEMLLFIQRTLRLPEEKVEEMKYTLDEVELGEYIGYLIQRINGASEEDIQFEQKIEKKKRKNEAPKKE